MYIVAAVSETTYDARTMSAFEEPIKGMNKPIYTGVSLEEAKEAAKVAVIKNPSCTFVIFKPLMEITAKVDEMTEEKLV